MIIDVTHSAYQGLNTGVIFYRLFMCFYSYSLPFSPPITPLCFMLLVSSLRKSASHVSLVTTVMLRDSQCLQDHAGKVSSVWRVLIALTRL